MWACALAEVLICELSLERRKECGRVVKFAQTYNYTNTCAQEGKDAQGAEAKDSPTAAEAQASAARSVRHLARKHKRDYPDAAATRVRQVCGVGALVRVRVHVMYVCVCVCVCALRQAMQALRRPTMLVQEEACVSQDETLNSKLQTRYPT